MEPYDEQQVVAFQAEDVQGAYQEAGQTLDVTNVVWSTRMQYDAVTIGYTASRAKHLAELRIALGLTPPFPCPPLRNTVCGVRLTFQGLTVQTQQYGLLPWFEVALDQLTAADRQAVYAVKHACGDTHLALAISHAYLEPGIQAPLSTGKDWMSDLAGFRALVEEVIRARFTPMIFLAGDGQSVATGYNDPVGWTYGQQWLLDNLSTIVSALQAGVDLTPYCLFVPGFDGVFYGWQPEQVGAFGHLFRTLLPNGYLAIEHNTGHLPCGEGDADWVVGGRMQTYDVLLSEFDRFPCGDEVWQIAARTLGPAYTRPSDQPVQDDPHPPWYLRTTTARGPYMVCAFEWVGLYDFLRGRSTTEQCARERAYLQAIGYTYTG